MTIQSFNRFVGIMEQLCAPGLKFETEDGPADLRLKNWSLSMAAVNRAVLFCLDDSAYDRALDIAGELPNAERECFPGIPGDRTQHVIVTDSRGVVMLHGVQEHPPGQMMEAEFGAVEIYRTLTVTMHYGGQLAPGLAQTNTDVVVMGRIVQTAPHGGPVLRQSQNREKKGMRSFCIGEELLAIQQTSEGFYGNFVSPTSLAAIPTSEEISKLSTPQLQAQWPSFVKGDFVSAVNTFLDELHYIDLPRHYVVESMPRHVAENPEKFKKREAKRISRFQDRPHWVVMDPEEIRRTWPPGPSKGGTHAAPIPHFRRGHEKLLAGERWTNKRGQIVRVRPSWVGDREWDHGAVKYRVISRQGSKEDQA